MFKKSTQDDETTMKPLQSKILLSGLSLLITLFIIELFFSFFVPQIIPTSKHNLKRGRFVETGIYRNHSPEFDVKVIVNDDGFTDYPWTYSSAQPIALLVGDSFVQSAQVNPDDGWGRKLNTLFTKNDIDMKVLSLGVPGAGTATEFELIKKYAPILKPKIIYLSFLVDNDIFNNHWDLESKQDKPFYQIENDELVLSWKDAPETESFLLRNSHFSRWIYRKYWKRNEQKRRLEEGDGVPLNFHVHNSSPDETWDESWKLTQKIFSEMAQYCQRNDISLQIVLTPAHWQISKRKEEQLKKQFPSMKYWNIETFAYQRSKIMIEELNVEVIDLYPNFQKHSNPDSLYYSIDGHWTRQGYALAAQTLYLSWK